MPSRIRFDPGDPPDPEEPCDVCGGWAGDTCICPACPICDGVGNPKCYREHGLTLTVEQYKQWSPVYGPEAELQAKLDVALEDADALRAQLTQAQTEAERLRRRLEIARNAMQEIADYGMQRSTTYVEMSFVDTANKWLAEQDDTP